ncbi:hypothetical protein Hanom_Chr02g00146941 [Helianthus anomalus]
MQLYFFKPYFCRKDSKHMFILAIHISQKISNKIRIICFNILRIHTHKKHRPSRTIY